jgi:PAS domain S-box-containing protein
MEKRCLRVLLIEDDEDDYIVLRSMLSEISSTTFYLQWANTYEAGVQWLCRAEHDVCLLDYRLGGKDGLELLREVIARGCETPIILLTGQGGYDVDIEAMKAGAADFLVKGQMTPDLLERSVRYSIVQKHADLELRRYRDYLEQLVRERTMELEETNSKLQVEIDVRREAEKASRGLAAIVEGSYDAIISQTLTGIITSWNKAAETIYGYSAAEAIGRPVTFLIPPDAPDEVVNILKKIGQDERIVHYETIRLRKDGRKINVSLSVSPLRNDMGEIIGASAIVRDITERERMRKEREKLIAKLQQALAKVKTLKGLLPICAWCKKIRDDSGYWQQIEAYIREHTEADFSHGICPACAKKVRKEFRN